jgi:hypothetical protein
MRSDYISTTNIKKIMGGLPAFEYKIVQYFVFGKGCFAICDLPANPINNCINQFHLHR